MPECACGCGRKIMKKKNGYTRKFIKGHIAWPDNLSNFYHNLTAEDRRKLSI